MDTTDILRRTRQVFAHEAAELLQELDDALLALEADPTRIELINGVFRPMHTLKGSSATSGLADLAGFVHGLEDAYNAAREGRLPVTPELIDRSLKVVDVVRSYLGTDDPDAAGTLIRSHQHLVARPDTPSLTPTPPPPMHPGSPVTAADNLPNGPSLLHVRFQPARTIFYSGVDTGMFLDDLRALGPAQVRADTGMLPPFADMDPELCHLAWEAQVLTEAGEGAVREVFAFVADECELTIQPATSATAWLLPNEITFDAGAFGDFTTEGQEQLGCLEAALLELDRDPTCRAHLDDLFRRLHNLKGATHLLLAQARCPLPRIHALPQLAQLAHRLEDEVDAARASGAPLEPQILERLFHSLSRLQQLWQALVDGSPAVTEENPAPGCGAPAGTPQPAHTAAHVPVRESTPQVAAALAELISQSRLALQTLRDAVARAGGLTPAAARPALRTLDTLGRALTRSGARDAALAAATLARDCESIIQGAPPTEPASLVLQVNDLLSRLQELSPEPAHREKAATPPPFSTPPLHSPNPPTPPEPAVRSRSLRVDQDKIDRLMRSVGELLIARGTFPLFAERLGDQPGMRGLAEEIREAAASLSRLASELQDTVMSIRMLPLRSVLQKLPRLVRDLGRSLGKDVSLVTEGEETELDKTVLELIGDPLLHLVRNAVDHGIEPPGDRRAAGKPATGTVRIRAGHEAGHVVIRISDDGRGLDPEVLRAAAVRKGILTEPNAAALSESQAFNLIFAAGFSTASTVTDVSGRGVGMDVVQSNIRQAHGTVAIESRRGHGTTFVLRLPTSLMVSRGILLQAAGSEFVIPMQEVQDLVKVPLASIRGSGRRRFVHARGRVHLVACLEHLLDPARNAAHANELPHVDPLPVALVRGGDRVYGLAVDRFVGQVDVIVKPLSGDLGSIPVYDGAAILGDGRVVLVLNTHQLAA